MYDFARTDWQNFREKLKEFHWPDVGTNEDIERVAIGMQESCRVACKTIKNVE